MGVNAVILVVWTSSSLILFGLYSCVKLSGRVVKLKR